MKKVIFFLLIIILLPLARAYPQASIDLQFLQDISSLDLGAFLVTNNLTGQPRFFMVTITPAGKEVYVKGVIKWKQDLTGSAKEIANFETEKFFARIFFNDELGTSNLELKSVTGDRTLAEELAKRGKPTGVVEIILTLFDSAGNQIAENPAGPGRTITFLNPTNPVILMQQDQTLPLGNLRINWDIDPAATDYLILANDKTDPNASDESVLSSGNPLINNVSVGPVSTINLNDLNKRRDFLPGETIVVQVKKLVYDSGFPKTLPSNPVRFKIESTETPGNPSAPNEDLVRLANLVAGSVDPTFLNRLKSGEIQPNQIHIFDNNNNEMSFSDFVTLLNKLAGNQFLIVNFIPKS